MTIAELKSINLKNPPTEDLVESDFQAIFGEDLDLIPFPSGDPTRPDITSSQQQMTGFSTDISSVDSIAGPVELAEIVTFPTGVEPPTGDTIRNTWGFQGEEPAGTEALLGTNVGAAVDNAGGTESGTPQAFNVFFSKELTGVEGAANDFFIIDLIGDDGVEIRPIDSAGNLIDDFSLELKSGPGEGLFDNDNLGDFGIVENFELAASSENLSNLGLSEDVTIDDLPLAGIAFDIEDFKGTGELTSLSGFQITPLNLDDSISSADGSIDILAVGHNSLAAEKVKGNSELIFASDFRDLIDAVGSGGKNRIYTESGDDNLILGRVACLVGKEGSDRFSNVADALALPLVSQGISDARRVHPQGARHFDFRIAAAEIYETANMITDSIDGEDIIGIAGLNLGFEDINMALHQSETI